MVKFFWQIQRHMGRKGMSNYNQTYLNYKATHEMISNILDSDSDNDSSEDDYCAMNKPGYHCLCDRSPCTIDKKNCEFRKKE